MHRFWERPCEVVGDCDSEALENGVYYIRQCYANGTSGLAWHYTISHSQCRVWGWSFDIEMEYSADPNIRRPLHYKGIVLQLHSKPAVFIH